MPGLWSEYLGRKAAKKQAEALSIKYRTNLADALEEAGKGTAATQIKKYANKRGRTHSIQMDKIHWREIQ